MNFVASSRARSSADLGHNRTGICMLCCLWLAIVDWHCCECLVCRTAVQMIRLLSNCQHGTMIGAHVVILVPANTHIWQHGMRYAGMHIVASRSDHIASLSYFTTSVTIDHPDSYSDLPTPQLTTRSSNRVSTLNQLSAMASRGNK